MTVLRAGHLTSRFLNAAGYVGDPELRIFVNVIMLLGSTSDQAERYRPQTGLKVAGLERWNCDKTSALSTTADGQVSKPFAAPLG